MSKTVSMVILIAGIVLIIFGLRASNSFSSDISRFFTGSPTDKTIWMLMVGGAASFVELVQRLRK